MSRPQDQARLEVWIPTEYRDRLALIAAAYGIPVSAVVRTAIKALFINLGVEDERPAPSVPETAWIMATDRTADVPGGTLEAETI